MAERIIKNRYLAKQEALREQRRTLKLKGLARLKINAKIRWYGFLKYCAWGLSFIVALGVVSGVLLFLNLIGPAILNYMGPYWSLPLFLLVVAAFYKLRCNYRQTFGLVEVFFAIAGIFYSFSRVQDGWEIPQEKLGIVGASIYVAVRGFTNIYDSFGIADDEYFLWWERTFFRKSDRKLTDSFRAWQASQANRESSAGLLRSLRDVDLSLREHKTRILLEARREMSLSLNLNQRHWDVLDVLRETPLLADEVGNRLAFPRIVVSQHLNQLSEEKLVEETGGRPYLYKITDSGQALLQKIESDFEKLEIQANSGLDRRAVQNISEILIKMGRAFKSL